MSAAVVKGTSVPGWFGKLPNVGDFASRRLPEAFVRRWDRWLQGGLARARDDAASDWLAGYLVAPIHRFWIAGGVINAAAWAGLVMPSVDRVGRHFPLTIARPIEGLAAALAARGWYRALDGVARQVLDIDFTIDDFERALAGLAVDTPGGPDDAVHALASRLLEAATPGETRTVWWCDDADDPAQFACFAQLPPPAALAVMLGAAA
jgi:type VI secretion system protein ImpM